jgi:hypothetical protein
MNKVTTPEVTKEKLSEYFVYPIHIAASLLDLTVADLKDLLKHYNIKRWPYTASRNKSVGSNNFGTFSEFQVNKKQKTSNSSEIFGNIQVDFKPHSLKPNFQQDPNFISQLVKNHIQKDKNSENLTQKYPTMASLSPNSTPNFEPMKKVEQNFFMVKPTPNVEKINRVSAVVDPLEAQKSMFSEFDLSDVPNVNIEENSKKRDRPDGIEILNFELDFELEAFYQDVEEYYDQNLF